MLILMKKHLHLHHLQVCWLIQLLVKKSSTEKRNLEKLTKDGATLILLLKTQLLACRSRGLNAIGLAISAPGETLLAIIYTCLCRYGLEWARWRQINGGYPKDGNEETFDLGLDANLKITSVTGFSNNISGNTSMLQARLSDGATWGPHGRCGQDADDSEHPSPSSPPLVLSETKVH